MPKVSAEIFLFCLLISSTNLKQQVRVIVIAEGTRAGVEVADIGLDHRAKKRGRLGRFMHKLFR